MVSQEAEFDILFELDGSKRPLTVTSDTAFIAIEQEIGKLNKDISLLPLNERIADQTDRSKPLYVLQRWCSKFSTFVDVRNKEEFVDETRLTVSLVSDSSRQKSEVR